MTDELIEKLQFLADKYENPDFLKKDPSQFMHRYSEVRDVEAAAFIAANLAFGRRDQILSHVQTILDDAEQKAGSLSEWILNCKYRDMFIRGEKSFYRMYTDNDMLLFFDTLKMMMEENGTIGEYVKNLWNEKKSSDQYLHLVVADIFPKNCKLLPHTKDSAAKKVNMLLRWLVRDNSPVDLGLWTWYDKKNLLMPLDTHVLQESVKFGLLSTGRPRGTDPLNNANGTNGTDPLHSANGTNGTDPSDSKKINKGSVPSGTLKSAVKLTESMKEAFPDDPVRGDFALFGLGVAEA